MKGKDLQPRQSFPEKKTKGFHHHSTNSARNVKVTSLLQEKRFPLTKANSQSSGSTNYKAGSVQRLKDESRKIMCNFNNISRNIHKHVYTQKVKSNDKNINVKGESKNYYSDFRIHLYLSDHQLKTAMNLTWYV